MAALLVFVSLLPGVDIVQNPYICDRCQDAMDRYDECTVILCRLEDQIFEEEMKIARLKDEICEWNLLIVDSLIVPEDERDSIYWQIYYYREYELLRLKGELEDAEEELELLENAYVILDGRADGCAACWALCQVCAMGGMSYNAEAGE